MRNDALTPRQLKYISATLTSSSIAEAAGKAGVNPASVWRWMKSPAFVEEQRYARRRVIDQTASELAQLGKAAIGALRRNLECGDPNVEVRCIAIVLEHSALIRSDEVEERLAALEQVSNTPARRIVE